MGQLAEANLTLTLRPRDFGEVIGLETAVKSIKSEIDSGRLPRGFLLTGPYGCGKTTLAWIIARYIQGPFFEGTPQVTEINGANYRKIDDMRRLADAAGSYPMVGTYHVIILDECQQLTKDAQQILLKELEVKVSPTVWILPTTDPQKINGGVQDRCFKVKVEGLDAPQRKLLVERGAQSVGHSGPLDEFLAEVTRAKVVSPRKILMAFEMFHNGTPAKDAVSAMHYDLVPEHFDIAMGIVFGKWSDSYSLGWIKDKDGVARRYACVAEQFSKAEAAMKKKPEEVIDGEEAESKVDDEDLVVEGKQQAAQAIRMIVATLLKNRVLNLKGSEKDRTNAAKAAWELSHWAGEGVYGMEWPATIAVMYRVHQQLKSA